MLDFNQKIDVFVSLLNQEELSYADTFNADISIYGMNCNYMFLNNLESKQEIELRIDRIKNKIVMKEDEATLEDIFEFYS